MADQRGGEVRNKKTVNLTDADDGIQKIDHSGGDGWGDLFTAEYFKQLNSGRDTYAPVDLNVGAFELHGEEKSPGNAQMISNYLEGIFVDDDDEGGLETAPTASDFIGSSSLDDLLSDLKFENLEFGSGGGGEIFEDTNGGGGFVGVGIRIRTRPSSGFSGFSQGTAPRRIRQQKKLKNDDAGEDSESQEFGRDTNRLDYFRVTAFDLHGDDNLAGIATHGGGGTRDRGVVVGPRMEQERGSDHTAVAGGGIRRLQGRVRFSANNSSEAVVQRSEQERGSATAGGGGGDRTREVPDGIFANNGSDGSETIVKKLKQEGATVAVSVPMVVVAVAVTMVVMVIVMVVLLSVMLKKDVSWEQGVGKSSGHCGK